MKNNITINDKTVKMKIIIEHGDLTEVILPEAFAPANPFIRFIVKDEEWTVENGKHIRTIKKAELLGLGLKDDWNPVTIDIIE